MKTSIVLVRPAGKPAVATPFPSYSEGLAIFRGVTIPAGSVELWCSRRGIVKRNKFELAKPEAPKPEAPKVEAPKAEAPKPKLK